MIDETHYVIRTMTWGETIDLGRAGVDAYVLDIPDRNANDILNMPCRVFVPVTCAEAQALGVLRELYTWDDYEDHLPEELVHRIHLAARA